MSRAAGGLMGNLTQIQEPIFLDSSEMSRGTGWSHDPGRGHTLTFYLSG